MEDWKSEDTDQFALIDFLDWRSLIAIPWDHSSCGFSHYPLYYLLSHSIFLYDHAFMGLSICICVCTWIRVSIRMCGMYIWICIYAFEGVYSYLIVAVLVKLIQLVT